jgi:hypothetical protein
MEKKDINIEKVNGAGRITDVGRLVFVAGCLSCKVKTSSLQRDVTTRRPSKSSFDCGKTNQTA